MATTMGIRELRDSLTQTFRRIRDEGEVIEVTLDGEPIATITPIPRAEDRLDRLVRLGLARPPRNRTFSLNDLPTTELPRGLTSEDLLADDRGD